MGRGKVVEIDGILVRQGKRRRKGVAGLSPWQRFQARLRGELPPLENEHLRNNRKKHNNADLRRGQG